MRTIFVLAAASYALVASAAAQVSVTFAPVLPTQPLRYEVTADYSLRRGPTPEAPGTVLKQSATLRFDAPERQPPGGLALHMTIEKLRVEVTVFDSIAPTGKVTLLEWDGTGEVTLPPGAPPSFAAYPKLVKTGADIRLRGDGSVEAITGHEAAYAPAKAGDQPRASSLGSFAPAGMVALVEALFAVDPDARPRTVGDSWPVMQAIQYTQSRQALATTKLTFTGAEGDVAKVAGDLKIEIQPAKGVPDAADPKMSLLEHKGSAEILWDTKAGRLVSRTNERYLVWEVELDARAKPTVMRDYTSSRLTAKLVGK